MIVIMNIHYKRILRHVEKVMRFKHRATPTGRVV